MKNILSWLYIAYLCYRFVKRSLFSQRRRFLTELRPIFDGCRIAYPEAFFHITYKDYTRAKKFSLHNKEAA